MIAAAVYVYVGEHWHLRR